LHGAQTGQFFDLFHRPDNVHDSNGAAEFMRACFAEARAAPKGTRFESRVDSAFFNQQTLSGFDDQRVEFAALVPFERFNALKAIVENRKRWKKIDSQWSYFETTWKPNCWNERFRFIFTRKNTKRRQKGPIQLDLFEPRDGNFDYKVLVTNYAGYAKRVVLFHHGRGGQEAIFGEAKKDAAFDAIATKRLIRKQLFTLCAMMAHNLSRELQMLATPTANRALPKRPAAWAFENLTPCGIGSSKELAVSPALKAN
jgi:Transposase DDE domain group 1